MIFAKAIFNKKGKWHWVDNDRDVALSLSSKAMNDEWFVADLFVPEYPDYDTNIHKHEIDEMLRNPDKLVAYSVTDQIKKRITEIETVDRPLRDS